jgi:hypothetical protein
VYTTSVTIKNSYIYKHPVFMCFVQLRNNNSNHIPKEHSKIKISNGTYFVMCDLGNGNIKLISWYCHISLLNAHCGVGKSRRAETMKCIDTRADSRQNT